jgi:hypothetical protein
MQDPALALLLCWPGAQLLPLLPAAVVAAVLASPVLQNSRQNLLQDTAVLAWA